MNSELTATKNTRRRELERILFAPEPTSEYEQLQAKHPEIFKHKPSDTMVLIDAILLLEFPERQ